jgi:hypothetical protein
MPVATDPEGHDSGETGPPNVFTGAVPTVECTVPATELRHYITDEELGRLGEMKRDHLTELFWGFLGATLGGIIPSISAVAHFNAKTDPMGKLELVVCLLTAMALAATVLTAILLLQRSRGRKDLLGEIRGRPKMRVVPHA